MNRIIRYNRKITVGIALLFTILSITTTWSQNICEQCHTERIEPDYYMEINIAPPNSKKPNFVTVEVIDGIAYQGDIELGEINSILRRGASKGGLWENSTIPYLIEEDEFTFIQQSNIRSAINEVQDNTNLCLVPRTIETDYIHFRFSTTICSSKVGKTGSVQKIQLLEVCANSKVP